MRSREAIGRVRYWVWRASIFVSGSADAQACRSRADWEVLEFVSTMTHADVNTAQRMAKLAMEGRPPASYQRPIMPAPDYSVVDDPRR